MRYKTTMAALASGLLAAGCAHLSVAPIEVKPIHIVQDININLKVDKELDNFFAFQEKAAATQPATTQSAPASASASDVQGDQL